MDAEPAGKANESLAWSCNGEVDSKANSIVDSGYTGSAQMVLSSMAS